MGDAILYAAMFSASVLSGILGVGVAFAAVPILGMAGGGPIDSIQQIALLLNGVTALCSAVSFVRSGYVDWPQCLRLTLVASIFSPFGAFAARWVHGSALWGVYILAVIGAIYLLLNRRIRKSQATPFGMVLLVSAPASAIGGMLGVGPGILLVPAMIILGFNARTAAAATSVAVTASSFVSLDPHFAHAAIAARVVLPLVLASAAGAYLGGYLSSNRVSETALRQLFVAVIVALTMYTGISLGETRLQQVEGYASCSGVPVLARTRPGNAGYRTEERCAPVLPVWLTR